MRNAWWVSLQQLDDLQKEVIDLPPDGSYLVKGPPGSGKTNLLLLRANWLYLAGKKDILVIVFTRTLQEFIVAGSAQYNFPSKKVVTFHRWAADFLREHGRSGKPTSDDFNEQRKFYASEIGKVIEEEELENVYSAILLDEAQDYLPEEIRLFFKLASTVFAAADSRQKIYDGPDSLKSLEEAVDEVHQLKYHYRSGAKICKVADAIAKGNTKHDRLTVASNYVEKSQPSSVEHIRCKDREDEADKIIKKLSVQLKAYPGELLGVICPKKEDALKMWEYIQSSPLASVAILQLGKHHAQFSADKSVVVCSFHSAKGLEVRALHIAAFEKIERFKQYQRNLAFMAITRAKTSLSIYYSEDIPGYLEQALTSLNPLPDLPSSSAAFGGGR